MRKSVFLVVVVLMFSFPVPCQAQEGTEYNIKGYLEDALPPQEGRRIVVNEAVGLLTITDTLSHHKIIRRLLDLIDIGPSQISIEARFVELILEDLHELGVEWSGNYVEPLTAPGGKVKGITGWAKSYFGAGRTVNGGMGFWFSKTYLSGSQLAAYLRALERTGRANMLSSPRVTTLNSQPAIIQIVKKVPYASEIEEHETGGWTTFTIEEEITGITLEVTPTVGEGNVIALEICPKIKEVVDRVSVQLGVPDDLKRLVIDTRRADTNIIVKNGETVVLGGLIKDEDTVTTKKVPILGDIPLIGKLFQYKYSKREKRNLVIFITATLVSAEGEEVL